MEELKRLWKVLEDNFNIDADIDERGDGVEGASEYVIALVIAPHEGTKNRWMLRMAARPCFDRWANSTHLELFFYEIDDLISYLEQEQRYIWMRLFKCLSGEYDELLEVYNRLDDDFGTLYSEYRANTRWVPVTEGLPRPGVKVLVTVKGQKEACDGWVDENGYWTTQHNLWERRLEPVTHWKKKPKAFKEDSK